MTPAQCCAARAYLGWTMAEVYKRSGLSSSCISDYENGKAQLKAESMTALLKVFAEAGIIFLTEGVILLPNLKESKNA